MSASAWPDWLVPQPAQAAIVTLDAAQTLNFSANPNGASPVLAASAIGAVVNHGGAGEVDWYSFTLNQASDVQLTTLDQPGGNHLDSVLSLFNTELQDFNYPLFFTAPPFDPQQHRLLSQVDSSAPGSPGYIERQLAAGTYFVAVSGHGDQYFNPFLADSGYAGSTGDFRLLVTANPLPIASTDGPAVLAVDPGLSNGPTAMPVLDSSPLAIYVDFSSPIDPGSVSLQQSLNDGSSVQLTYNPTGNFGNGNDSAVILNGFHYAADTMELQLQIAAPLGPGFYQLTLAGSSSSGNQVLTDPTDTITLGQNQDNPTGQDYTTTFQIDGSEGTPGTAAVSDDTAATAQNLGDITQSGHVQAAGAIGDDPAYNPINPTALTLANPASQVDLYHFQVSGPGLYEFSAEVFAGRIGSTLDAALSLFRVDASSSQSPLQLVASNDNSGNQTWSSNGQLLPLFLDPVLDVGLTAGDYYVAVSSSGNMPDLHGNPPGSNGIFDPNVTESGVNGISTGPYVLNLLVQPAAPAPQVVSTSIPAGATLTGAPTLLTVAFDSTVNLLALANQADSGSVTTEPTIASVFIVEPNGQRVFPGLLSYDPATNQATFLMLDRLPNGVNQLHLSGANGLTGLGGNPLAGNDPSGDYVVSFTVADPAAPADPLNRTEDTLANTPGTAQDLGVLFPGEVQSGVTIAGTLAALGSGDGYTIQLLEPQEYQFALNGPPLLPGGPLTSLPDNLQMTITDATGTAVSTLLNGNPNTILANLAPGSYTIQISQSSGDTTLSVPYELFITMLYTHENPPPLSVGATPVLQIRLAGNPPPTPSAGQSPGLTPPGSNLLLVPPGGPTLVAPVAYVQAGSAGNDGASIGSSSLTQSAPGILALTLRADPVGGVTSGTTGTLVALAPPLQVQGLSNGSVYLASNLPTSSAILLSFLIVTPSISVNELSLGNAIQPMDSIWPYLKEWLAPWTRLLEFLPRSETPSTSVPQPGSEPTSRTQQETPSVPPILDVQVALSGSSRALAEVTVLDQGVGSSPGAPILSKDTTTANPGEDALGSCTNGPVRRPNPWISGIVSTTLAAFLICRRFSHVPEPNDSTRQRKAQLPNRSFEVGT